MGHRGRPDYSLHPSRAPKEEIVEPRKPEHMVKGMTPRHRLQSKKRGEGHLD